MAGSSAALTDDDILSAYSKPAPSGAAPVANPDDEFLRSFSKPAPAAPAAPEVPSAPVFVDPATGATGGPVPSVSAPDGWAQQPGAIISLADRFKQNPISDRLGGTQDAVRSLFGLNGPSAMSVEGERLGRGEAVRQQGGTLGDILRAQGSPAGSPVVMGFGAAPSASGGSIAGIVGGNRLLAAPTETPMAMPAAQASGAPVAVGTVPGGNPLAAAPEVTPNRLAAPASPAAPESVVTPTEGPTPKLLPVRTPAQADAEADRIIRHFAGNGSATISPQEIIPGSSQTLSRAIEGGNPGISGLESRIAETFPNDFVALDKKNQAARSAHFDALAGSEADVRAASGERDAAFQAADRAVFDPANVKPTDPSPVIAQIDQVLAGREGQRSTVASALKDVRAKLVDDKGNLQTNPDLLYGVRKSINDDIAPAAKGTANDKTQAARELIEIRNALDPVIEAGAPGFTKFINDYSAASAPIDGMKYLQGMKLTDTQGNITLQKLDTAIKSLERIQALPGARAGDGVSADQLAGLHALREDMRLDAKRQLGKAVGSNTVQNLGTNRVLSTLGHPLVGATGIGGSIANPWIGIPAMAARFALQKAGDKGQEMVFEALRRKLLNPQDAASAFQPRQ